MFEHAVSLEFRHNLRVDDLPFRSSLALGNTPVIGLVAPERAVFRPPGSICAQCDYLMLISSAL